MLPSVVAAQRASAGASACGPCEGLDADLAAGTSGPWGLGMLSSPACGHFCSGRVWLVAAA